MRTAFWSPTKDGKTAQNMSILANTLRLRRGMRIRTFHNCERVYQSRWEKRGDESVFVDCAGRRDACVNALLRTADVVVVNFPENEQIITEYFLEHHEMLGKVFYLMNSSLRHSLNYQKLCKEILRLKEEEMGVLPYSFRFEEKYRNGQGFFYQKQAFYRGRDETDREFSRKTYEIAVKLLKMNCLFI